MDDNIFFIFPIEGPKKIKSTTDDHKKAHENILKLADTSLYSYKSNGNYIDNGLCIKDNARYCKTHDDEFINTSKKFKSEVKMQTLVGDLVSSINILSKENKDIKEKNGKLLEKIDTLEQNLVTLRNSLKK
jgi:hypothetical protein